MDVFITLLHLGRHGYSELLALRKVRLPCCLATTADSLTQQTFESLRTQLQAMAAKHGERVLETTANPISLGTAAHVDASTTCIGMTLSTLEPKDITFLGSMLFQRNVSGARCTTWLYVRA